MRVLCVGRHVFLSEHLCRFFGDAGRECEPVVGVEAALRIAAVFEPHVVVSDADLITPALLDSWSRQPALTAVPVLAVSLTRRPLASSPAELSGVAAAVYLPTLDREQAAALLSSLYRPRGVSAPSRWCLDASAPSVHTT